MEKKILVVDDTPWNRRLIKMLVSRVLTDISVLEASGGVEALEIMNKNDITVVILDIMMPDMDGIEVLRKIKSNVKLMHIPIIMWSAINETESLEKSLELGALDYFTKPLTAVEMRVALPFKIKNAIKHYEHKLQLMKFNEHIKSEIQLAEKLQRSLITDQVSFETEEMRGKYIPCEGIGGDFFSCRNINGKTWFIIADVSGHGIASAMLSTMISVVYTASIQISNEPSEVLKKINNLLYKTFEGYENSLASAIVGVIEGERISISTAGHPKPIIYRKDQNKVEKLDMSGFLLGIFEDVDFEVETRNFYSGDAIILYTDGLYDIARENDFCKVEEVQRFCELNKFNISRNLDMFIDDLISFFYNKNGKEFVDDVAVLGILKK